jgi:hypothetical protein
MSDQEITNDELDQDGELLPDREAMSVVTPLGEDLAIDPKLGDPGLPPPQETGPDELPPSKPA